MAVTVDQSKCTGCGRCAQVCPMGAITVDRVAEIDAAQCADCCVCVAKCPFGALGLPEAMTRPAIPAAARPVAPEARKPTQAPPEAARPVPAPDGSFAALAAGGMLVRVFNFFRLRSRRGCRRGRRGRRRRGW